MNKHGNGDNAACFLNIMKVKGLKVDKISLMGSKYHSEVIKKTRKRPV